MRYFLIGLLLISQTAGCRLFDSVRDDRLKRDLREKIERVNCRNEGRLEAARQVLTEAGARAKKIEYENASNVVAKSEGVSDETIVVGAHFDKTTLGCGAIDNWTGVVMLARLFQEVSAAKTDKSYTFVAFGGEERDLLGSRAMAKDIADGLVKKPCAMINMDSFGFEKAWGLKSISDQSMLMLAADVERKRGGSFSIRNYSGASSDSKSFRLVGVPSITFSGLGDDWREYLHQETDQVKNIDFEMVAENYSFLMDFLQEIDRVDCQSLKK